MKLRNSRRESAKLYHFTPVLKSLRHGDVTAGPRAAERHRRRDDRETISRLERLKAENRELKRRRRYKSDAAPSTRARRQRRVANYAEDPDFEP